MMKNIKDEGCDLFIATLRELSSVGEDTIFVSATIYIYIDNRKMMFGARIIIDDILLWYSNVCALFVYCICKVTKKYWVIVWLDKCDILKPRVEYVGYDVTNDGNYPVSSKFSMINYCKILERGEMLFSFLSLINFYHQYAPYIEIRLKSLRKLLK